MRGLYVSSSKEVFKMWLGKNGRQGGGTQQERRKASGRATLSLRLQLCHQTRSGTLLTSDIASPGLPARPTLPTRCMYLQDKEEGNREEEE